MICMNGVSWAWYGMRKSGFSDFWGIGKGAGQGGVLQMYRTQDLGVLFGSGDGVVHDGENRRVVIHTIREGVLFRHKLVPVMSSLIPLLMGNTFALSVMRNKKGFMSFTSFLASSWHRRLKYSDCTFLRCVHKFARKVSVFVRECWSFIGAIEI